MQARMYAHTSTQITHIGIHDVHTSTQNRVMMSYLLDPIMANAPDTSKLSFILSSLQLSLGGWSEWKHKFGFRHEARAALGHPSRGALHIAS